MCQSSTTNRIPNVTLVTGIFDLNRGIKVGSLNDVYIRPFQFYIDNLINLLQVDMPMSIYLEPEFEGIIWKHRKRYNTHVFLKEAETFRTEFPFYYQVQAIRSNPAWRAQAGWLEESVQANLELYNPMVMSKMGMLHDQSIINPFSTEHFVWIDGAITNTVHPSYLVEDRLLHALEPLLRRFLFLCFPYESNNEIHGFERAAMHRFAQTTFVKWVARGGLFGGRADSIRRANQLYYRLMEETLDHGYMGTEESLFTLMTYLEPYHYDRFMLNEDGLLVTFFEHLKRGTIKLETSTLIELPDKRPKAQHETSSFPSRYHAAHVDISKLRTALYVVSFNTPDQLKLLLESWTKQPGFVSRTENYLLDNSTDRTTFREYARLCHYYGFTHLKLDNLGDCGTRQYVAEHFATSGCDYMIYLEDDMLLKDKTFKHCVNGLPGYVNDLYRKLLLIMELERFDFLKLSFTEFFGNNGDQWAWYNVPQHVREELWPALPNLPEQGLADIMPRTQLDSIGSIAGLSYVTGEIFYANWPQIVSQGGNRKMFLETKWAHPYEQTWVSHMFQLARQKQLRPAVLLASPINHHRTYHYHQELRKVS